MSTMDRKAFIDGMTSIISAKLAAGDLDGAAQSEMIREYFTNEEFRGMLADMVWAIGSKA